MIDDYASPDVSVVIVTYNSAGVIRACLDALGHHSSNEVIVIDNLSSDSTVKVLRAEYPWVRVIENDENAGFGRAVNKAAESARGRHILLLNPDALISSEAVGGLADRLDAMPGIGAMAPLVGYDGTDVRVITAGHAPTIWRMLLHQTGLSRLGSVISRLEGHYLFRSSFRGGLRDVDWTSGGCVMVRASLWRQERGLCDRWFMYAEDVEFCLRIRSHGFRVVIDADLVALHAIGGSSAGVDGRVNTAWITNLYDLYSWRLARNDLHSALWKAVVLAGFASRWLVFRVRELTAPNLASLSRVQRKRYSIYLRALFAASPSREHDRLVPDLDRIAQRKGSTT